MKSALANMSDDDLVTLFTEIGLQQDKAELEGEIAKLKRLTFKLWDVEEELKARSGDQRRLLVPLYGHKNAWVRINAIEATLAINPEEARRQLQILAGTHEHPPSARARGALRGLDDGTYKPS